MSPSKPVEHVYMENYIGVRKLPDQGVLAYFEEEEGLGTVGTVLPGGSPGFVSSTVRLRLSRRRKRTNISNPSYPLRPSRSNTGPGSLSRFRS